MAEQQKQLQDLTDEFSTLQTALQTIVDGRQKLESQQQENQGVQAELDKIPSDANVYKLVGPVLLKQDKGEAGMAVKGRLEFIEKEIKRIEKQIGEVQEKSERKKMDIITLQTQMQQLAQPQAAS
ncbi:Prefoldin [Phyllosticta citrichinensis]|uniref:Prefoldin n=1 Tax=Phyllosticta citrichinensis TaxID=1130410 RepID=A0ABR1XS84_9PEZI